MTPSTLKTLSDKLDAVEPLLARLDGYYNGEQPLAFLAPEAKVALNGRLTAMCSNIPRLAVTSLAERLRVNGFRVGGVPIAVGRVAAQRPRPARPHRAPRGPRPRRVLRRRLGRPVRPRPDQHRVRPADDVPAPPGDP